MMRLSLFVNIILIVKTGLLTKWFRQHGQVWQILWKALKPVLPVKKTELKLTNVAKASQEELLEDYRSFLRQRELPMWDAQSVHAQTVREARPENLTQLRQLMACLVSDLSEKSDQSDYLEGVLILRDSSCKLKTVAGNAILLNSCISPENISDDGKSSNRELF